ncbi:MAG: hypothetical protein CMJ32_09650 [Phycisphaerae bacterium]|nr:hypothetical protein [Phycisphaerae bacterium]
MIFTRLRTNSLRCQLYLLPSLTLATMLILIPAPHGAKPDDRDILARFDVIVHDNSVLRMVEPEYRVKRKQLAKTTA